MRWTARIAYRYLFAKRRQGAIHVVSGVSTAGIAIVTATMICVLSVMNGFSKIVASFFSEFDPTLKVVPAEGKFITDADSLYFVLSETEGVAVVSREIRETALIQYKDHRMPATIMGVDSLFEEITHIDSIISDGYFCLYDGAFERTVMGRGLAAELGMNAHFVGGIHIYAPQRTRHYSATTLARAALNTEDVLNEGLAFIAGTFAVNQTEYDDQVMLVSLNMAQHLFDCDSTIVTAFNIDLDDGVNVKSVARQLQRRLGIHYNVLTKEEQHADFFRIAKAEKGITMLLMLFILLIAGFNTIGSLSMLIIEKKEDIRTLSHIGASTADIRQVFLLEGWFVSMLGAIIGIVIGLVLCLLQQELGLIKLGNGADYVISSYPVQVQFLDILYVLISVMGLSAFMSWIPSHKIHVEGV